MKLRERLSGQSLATYVVIGLSVGTCVGAAIGAALNDIGVGIAVGLGAGVVIGSMTVRLDKEKNMPQARPGRNKKRNGT